MAFLAPSLRSVSTATLNDSLFREIAAVWRDFVAAAFDPYQPELHYMRGPGPAWRAKHEHGCAHRRSARSK
jgi:hypothetical protein